MVDNATTIKLRTFAANNRAVLGKYGENIGRQIFCVKEAFVDLKVKENERVHRENNILFLSKPVKHYIIEKVDILSIDLGINASEKPVIILNGNIPGVEPIQCSLKTPDFDRKVTAVSVREAIEAQKDGGQSIYFSNLANLTREVNSLNAGNLKDITDLIDYLNNNRKTLVEETELNNAYLKKYHDECDREASEVTATMTIETGGEE